MHDWTDAACQTDIAEPADASLPAATTSNSPEWFLDPASTSSGHPAAVHQHHRPPVPGIKQNVQQSGCHGLSARGPQPRALLNLSASNQPANDRRSYLAHLADPGPTPKPAICSPLEGQVSNINAYGPPELSLPRSSLDQPAGWRISATHSPHQPCTAARICPTTQAGNAPLPGVPIRASLNAAQPSAISGLLPLEVAHQLAVGQALLQKGQQQLPPSGFMPPAPRFTAPVPTAMPPASRRSQVPPTADASSAHVSVLGPAHKMSPAQPRQLLQVSQHHMGPEPPSSAWDCNSQPDPEGRRAQKRLRRRLNGESGMRMRSVVPHQELAMAGALDDLRHVTAGHPASVEAQQHALQGVALARGRHMSEVSKLKQKNLQGISLHPDWHIHYNLSGNSLLDIYAAFASADMSFRVPLIVNGTQQFFSLLSLMQLDMPSLYRQSVAGLARVADHASQNPDSPAGQLFTKGSCQSLAVAVCVLEMPHHSAKLCDEHLMKDSSMRQGQVTGLDIMHRLELQLGGMRRSSVSLAQRRRAQEILIQHEAFTGRLDRMRQAVLQEMRHAVEAEDQAPAPQLLPSHILKLSDHAHKLSVLLGLAHESHLASGRKLFLEVLSPWQFGLIRACLYPLFSDVIYLVKWVAGDEPTAELPPLSDATVLPRFNKLQMQQQEE